MQKKTIIYGLSGLFLLAIAIGFSGYLLKAKPIPQKDNQKHHITYVKTEKVKITEVEADMSYRGRVTAFDNISLSAEVSGKILSGDVRFKTGESFKKGQVIVRIYSEDVEAVLKSSKSSFLQTISNILPDLKVDYSNEYEKWNTFFKAIQVGKALPPLPEINSNKEKVFLAANNVLSAYYNLQQQEINLKRYTIHAPFDGSFKTVNKEIGAVSSLGAELATLIRTDKLEITVPVFPTDLNFIKKGEKVSIINRNGLAKAATVSRIATFVDAATQSVNVYLSYPTDHTLDVLEGEYVDVRFAGEKVSGFYIPREALVNEQSVYRLDNGKLQEQKIKILRQLSDGYIIGGLNEETEIVTESLSTINSNVEYKAR